MTAESGNERTGARRDSTTAEAMVDAAMVGERDLPRVGVLLAGGASRRMGRPKALIEGADGETFLARLCRVLRDGGCDAVIVVAGCHVAEIARCLPPSVLLVRNDEWQLGQLSSVRRGLDAALRFGPRRVALHLVDQPWIAPSDVRALLDVEAAFDLAIATHGGEPGHPISLSPGLARAIARDDVSKTLRESLERHAPGRLLVEGTAGCVRGANTPEELSALTRFAASIQEEASRPPRN